ncbi:hypothetical protein QE152_g5727 [Popillia japonica]|uniref:Uncharacterized protein n=1 Tax=Popillia japonica TaxID=7064 RepID=A0AAW1MP61_POPJA
MERSPVSSCCCYVWSAAGVDSGLLEAGEWFGGNRLKLNDLKTKKLRISTTITKIEEQEVKFLGLVLTSSLNWSRHADNLRGILASAKNRKSSSWD